uniref:Uncharacterized protein n=1 Tax=Loa loa TaxID=7209 RepID=A0A1I7VFL2_LOALO
MRKKKRFCSVKKRNQPRSSRDRDIGTAGGLNLQATTEEEVSLYSATNYRKSTIQQKRKWHKDTRERNHLLSTPHGFLANNIRLVEINEGDTSFVMKCDQLDGLKVKTRLLIAYMGKFIEWRKTQELKSEFSLFQIRVDQY